MSRKGCALIRSAGASLVGGLLAFPVELKHVYRLREVPNQVLDEVVSAQPEKVIDGIGIWGISNPEIGLPINYSPIAGLDYTAPRNR